METLHISASNIGGQTLPKRPRSEASTHAEADPQDPGDVGAGLGNVNSRSREAGLINGEGRGGPSYKTALLFSDYNAPLTQLAPSSMRQTASSDEDTFHSIQEEVLAQLHRIKEAIARTAILDPDMDLRKLLTLTERLYQEILHHLPPDDLSEVLILFGSISQEYIKIFFFLSDELKKLRSTIQDLQDAKAHCEENVKALTTRLEIVEIANAEFRIASSYFRYGDWVSQFQWIISQELGYKTAEELFSDLKREVIPGAKSRRNKRTHSMLLVKLQEYQLNHLDWKMADDLRWCRNRAAHCAELPGNRGFGDLVPLDQVRGALARDLPLLENSNLEPNQKSTMKKVMLCCAAIVEKWAEIED